MYICGTCGNMFKKAGSLKTHMMTHTGQRPFQCTTCGKYFRERSHLNTHLLIHTGQKPFKCSQCEKSFNQNSNLTKHMKIHLDDRSHVCNVCGKGFVQRCYLVEHMKSHTGERPRSCPDCGKTFKNIGHLKSHMVKHSNERPFECSFCQKTFKYSNNYSRHIATHKGEHPLNCFVCGKVFLTKSNLGIHLLSHRKGKSLECFVCSKLFRNNDKFSRHMQMHLGQRPYNCSVCEKSFKLKSHLRDHMKYHTEDPNFKCSVCMESFKTISLLKCHMSVHNSVRTNKCNICKKTFNDKSSYGKHMKTHYGFDPTMLLHGISTTQHDSLCSTDFSNEDFMQLTSINSIDEAVSTIAEDEAVDKNDKITVISCSTECTNVDANYSDKTIKDLGGIFSSPSSKECVKIMIRSSTEEYPFHCPHCKDTFKREDQMNEHLKFHEKDNPPHCSICNIYFSNNNLLQIHMVKHLPSKLSENSRSDASGCRDSFTDLSFECTFCNIIFYEVTDFKNHIDSHDKFNSKQPLVYKCKICHQEFDNLGTLMKHKKTHLELHDNKSGPQGKRYCCDICGLWFLYDHSFETHKMIHKMNGNQKFLNQRNQEEVNQTIIQTLLHQSLMEDITDFDPVKTVLLVIEEKEMDQKVNNSVQAETRQMETAKDYPKQGVREMNQELNISVKVKTRQMETDKDNPEQEDGIDNHDDSIRNDKFTCDFCLEEFSNLTSYLKHLNEHKMQCLKCGKYIFEDNLERHVYKHFSEDTYSCRFCDKRFRKRSQLMTHKRSDHDNIIFDCKYCGRRLPNIFGYEKHLKDHELGRIPSDKKDIKTEEEKSGDTNDVELSGISERDSVFFATDGELKNKRIVIGNQNSNRAFENSFKCSECLETSGKDHDDRRYISIHTGNGSNCCSSCGRIFNRKNNNIDEVKSEEQLKVMKINYNRPLDSILSKPKIKDKLLQSSNTTMNISTLDKKGTGYITNDEHQKGSVQIQEYDEEKMKEIVDEEGKEVRLGKLSIQAIPYDAALKRRKILKETKFYRCLTCSRLFNRKGNLLRHMETHKNKMSVCHICKSKFKSEAHLDKHKKICNATVALEANKKARTEACPESFKLISQLESGCIRHKKTGTAVHPRVKIKRTEDASSSCNKTTTVLKTKSIKQEDNSHGDLNSAPTECVTPLPRNQIESRKPLSPIKIKVAHQAGRSGVTFSPPTNREICFACFFCDMKFPLKHHLEKHTFLIHGLRQEVKPDDKSHCEIVWHGKSALKEDPGDAGKIVNDVEKSEPIGNYEMLVPENERNKIGEIQMGNFAVKTIPYELAREWRKKAVVDKNRFKCNFCVKDFSSTKNLNRHKKMHLKK